MERLKNRRLTAADGHPLSDGLFALLQADILREHLKAGEKLTEQRICNEYEVSRTPVREALKQLELTGLIEIIPNRGAFVIGFSRRELEDLLALRRIYELQAVRWAIDRISKAELEQLEEIFEFMEFYTRKRDTRKMMDINSSFHQQIYNASHNRMLAGILSTYQTYIRHSKQTVPYDEDQLDSILEEHRSVFHAFQTANPGAGEEAMRIHMENSALRATGLLRR